MNFASFSFFTALGAGIWVAILTAIGFHFGHQSKEMSYAELVHQGKDMLSHNLIWILVAAAAIAAAWIWAHNRVMRSKKPPTGTA